ALTRDIARILACAEDADSVEIPLYGTARRQRFPAATMFATKDGEPVYRLELPETSLWIVDQVRPRAPLRQWNPPAPVIKGPSAFMPPVAAAVSGPSATMDLAHNGENLRKGPSR